MDLRRPNSPFGFLSILLILLIQGIGTSPLASQIVIGISKASPNYTRWLHNADTTVIWVDLFTLPADKAVSRLQQCSALLLTGGEDLYPGLHGKTSDTSRCTEIDRHRDSLELALIQYALSAGMPIFGICRGHQLLNVALGGTLIIDIPSDTRTSIRHQCEDYTRCHHDVKVVQNTFLSSIAGISQEVVTTNHHQAVDILSGKLRCAATSQDGLTEAIEWKEPQGKPFLLGVQWHPERMDRSNPLSGNLADAFIKQAIYYNNLKK